MEQPIPIMEQEIPKKRAAIYIRVSSQEQVEMYGEKLQMTSANKLLDLKSKDLEFAGEEYIYIDSAISGTNDIKDRPDLLRLFEDLEYSSQKPFDTIIVYKIDRLARKLSVLLSIIDRLEMYDVGFISTQESIDTDTPFGRAMLSILGVFAELERDTILEKTSGGYKEAQKDGVWMQDKYGYRRDPKTKRPIICEEEAKIVKKIFEWYVNDFMTITEICKELSKSKIQLPSLSRGNTGRGKKITGGIYNWGDNTVRKFLEDEVYIGNLYYNKTKRVVDKVTKKKKQINLPKEKWILSKHTHIPIIDEETFFKAQKRLEKKGDYKNSKETYILSGLLKCDHCKEYASRGMIQRKGTTSHGKTYYHCGGKDARKHTHKCNVVSLSKKALEEFIINNVKLLIQKPDIIEKFIKNSNYNVDKQKRLELLKNNLIIRKEKIMGKEERIKELYINYEISSETYHTKMDDLGKELKEIPNINLELSKTEKEIKHQVNESKYKKGFELLSQLTKNLNEIFSNEELTKKLFNYIIEEIIIYSRPKNDKDIISGKKKKLQYIPNHIEIVFKLPQEFFDEMLKQDMEGKDNILFPDYNSYDWSFYGKNTENNKKSDIVSLNKSKDITNSKLTKPIDDKATRNSLLHPI